MCPVLVIIAEIAALLIILKWLVYAAAFVFAGIYYRHKRKEYFEDPGKNQKENTPGKKSPKKVPARYYCIKGICKWVNNKIGSVPSHKIRLWCCRHILQVQLSDRVVIYKGVVFRDGYKCKIGAGTVIGDDCMLDARGGLEIGRNCNFSTGVNVWTAQHEVQSRSFAYVQAPVKIGSRCWISGGATILPGVNIEDGCVVASSAVVTKNCEAYGIYAGIPAKGIGDRNSDIDYEFSGMHDWFM